MTKATDYINENLDECVGIIAEELNNDKDAIYAIMSQNTNISLVPMYACGHRHKAKHTKPKGCHFTNFHSLKRQPFSIIFQVGILYQL